MANLKPLVIKGTLYTIVQFWKATDFCSLLIVRLFVHNLLSVTSSSVSLIRLIALLASFITCDFSPISLLATQSKAFEISSLAETFGL